MEQQDSGPVTESGEICGVEHEFDYVACGRDVGHKGRHSGIGDDGGLYVW